MNSKAENKFNFQAENSLGLLLEVTDEEDPVHDDTLEGEGSQIVPKKKKPKSKRKKIRKIVKSKNKRKTKK